MIHLCGARIYKYGKWTFECSMGAFSPLTKSGSPYKRIPNKFYEDTRDWLDMDEDDQEKYRVGGGCERLQ